MSDIAIPDKRNKKEGIWKEGEWREQWKVYNDMYAATQMDHKVRLLLKWFKEDFFTWVNSPQCRSCRVRIHKSILADQEGDTKPIGRSPPTEEEKMYTARDVELSQCPKCGQIERFPRYNDPVKLLSTRRGRCGEFANVTPTQQNVSNSSLDICIHGTEYGGRYSLGVEFRGSRLGGILLESTEEMDPFGPL